MSKPRKKPKKSLNDRNRREGPPTNRRSWSSRVISKRSLETDPNQTAEPLTVAWVITVLTAAACELGAVAASWFAGRNAEALGIRGLAALLTFAAIVLGGFSLLFTAVVLRSGGQRPPSPVLVFALVVGAAPLVMLFLGSLR